MVPIAPDCIGVACARRACCDRLLVVARVRCGDRRRRCPVETAVPGAAGQEPNRWWVGRQIRLGTDEVDVALATRPDPGVGGGVGRPARADGDSPDRSAGPGLAPSSDDATRSVRAAAPRSCCQVAMMLCGLAGLTVIAGSISSPAILSPSPRGPGQPAANGLAAEIACKSFTLYGPAIAVSRA